VVEAGQPAEPESPLERSERPNGPIVSAPLGESVRIVPNKQTHPNQYREVLLRRLSHIMLVRVILFTLVLGGTVLVHFAWRRPEDLGGPFVSVLFVFIATIYVINILYAAMLRLTRRLEHMAVAQIVVDLLTSAILVHFTGSAESGFVLFLLLSPVAAAVTLSRSAALWTAAAGSLLLALVVLLGYNGYLPVLVGQRSLPWDIAPGALARSLLLNTSAMFAVAFLAGYLADMLSSAAFQVERQRDRIADLAALHEDVIRCLSSGLLTIDPAGIVLTINNAGCEILALQARDVVGRPLHVLAPQLAMVATDPTLPRRHEVVVDVEGERRYLGVSISPLSDRQQRTIGCIVNFQDLTALRLMEQEIKRSEQLASLGRVAAGVAHELRNPLASISGSIELMKAEPELAEDTRRLMGIALREVERLDAMVRDLLTYARPSNITEMQPLDLAKHIHQMVEGIAAHDTHRLDVSVAGDGLWIAGNQAKLRGVLWNLVRNGWEASRDSEASVHIAVKGGQDDVTIAVSDHGEGIPEDDKEHIFEPFFTTKATGSGLGLAIAQRTINDHQGVIAIDSKAGKGTTFTITLPRVSPPEARRSE
jgi:two-component system sensor histidine kinase PilS (NtrC family)